MIPVTAVGPTDRPTILFLHGAGANQEMWAWHRQQAAQEYRVITLDLPGHGTRRDERWTMSRSITDVAEAIRANATRPCVAVGLSLGGYVALETAVSEPDLIDALVLSGSTATYTGWGGLSTKVYGHIARLLAGRFESKATESIAKVARPEIADPIMSAGMSMQGAADALVGLPGKDHHALGARFKGPILILNGERDKVNRKEESAARIAWQLATVQTIENAGHACGITQPERFLEAVMGFAKKIT